jgi:hypothetical protein
MGERRLVTETVNALTYSNRRADIEERDRFKGV